MGVPPTTAAPRVAAHFDEVAASWVERYASRPSFRHRLVVVGDVVAEVVGRHHQAAVLDFGGGPGVFSLVASERAAWVLCLDPSPAMIRAGAAHQALAGSVVRATGRDPEPARVARAAGSLNAIRATRPGTFDVVLAIAVLEYIVDPGQVIEALATRLRVGGHLVLTVPNPGSWFRIVEDRVGSLGARAGAVLDSERLRSRAYAASRPHGNTVAWADAAERSELVLEQVLPLSLDGRGPLSRVRATRIIVLRKAQLAG